MTPLKALLLIGTLVFAGCATPAQSQQPRSAASQDLASLLRAQGYTPIALRRVGNGLDTVSMRVNGAMGTFLLDTGASNSVIDKRALPQFKIASQNLLRSETAIGAGGDVTLSSYAISGLSINGRNFALKQISAADLSPVIFALARDTRIRLDGIIGQDVMIAFDGVIDTKSRTLFLRER